jgi:hypothetical protein
MYPRVSGKRRNDDTFAPTMLLSLRQQRPQALCNLTNNAAIMNHVSVARLSAAGIALLHGEAHSIYDFHSSDRSHVHHVS